MFAANQARCAAGLRRAGRPAGGAGRPGARHEHGVLHELRRLFSIQHGTLTKIGARVAAYALLEGAEAVGLWYRRRWAEYLTFVATAALLPLEVYELASPRFALILVTVLGRGSRCRC